MKTTKNLRLTAVLLFCVMLLGTFLTYGCQKNKGQYKNPGTMTREEMQVIYDAWEATHPDPFSPSFLHYGTCNGYVILFYQSGKFEGAIEDITKTVAGQEFKLHSDFELYVFKDGNFNTLEDAYARGWVTKNAIKKAAEYHDDFFNNK